jgi:hypothetical protein
MLQSTHLQAPAYAEAASRRQAKSQTLSSFQFRMTQTHLFRILVIWCLEIIWSRLGGIGIWILGFQALFRSGYAGLGTSISSSFIS